MPQRALLIVASRHFRDTAYEAVKGVLERRGCHVQVASEIDAPLVGEQGDTILPDAVIANIDPGNYDALVVLGGPPEIKPFLRDHALLALLRQAVTENRVVAGLGRGALALAYAGILAGRQATGHPDDDSLETLRASGAEIRGQPVVHDGLFVTGAEAGLALPFARAVADAMGLPHHPSLLA